MKIVIIDQKATPYSEKLIMGGVQSIIKCQLRLLKNDEVLFITSNNSEISSYENVTTKKVSVDSKYVSDLSGIKYNKKRNADILKYIHQFYPDIIINHDQSNNSVVKMLGDLDYPSITYMHNCPEVIGGIAGLSYVDTLVEYAIKNKLIVNVSDFSKKEWIKYFSKCKKDGELYLNTTHHALVNYDNIVPTKPENYILMISRISKDKRIHSAIELCKKANKKIILIHTSPRDEKEQEYFNLIEKELDIENRYCDISREQTLDILSKAEYVIVAGPEGMPLVPIEANLYGVPVIIYNSKTEHAAKEACSFGEEYGSYIHLSTNKSECIEILKNIKSVDIDQKNSISKITVEYFSEETSYKRLMSVIEKSIKINSVRKNDISLFL